MSKFDAFQDNNDFRRETTRGMTESKILNRTPIGDHGWSVTEDAFPGKLTLCMPNGKPHSSENNDAKGRKAIYEGWGKLYWSRPVEETTSCL